MSNIKPLMVNGKEVYIHYNLYDKSKYILSLDRNTNGFYSLLHFLISDSEIIFGTYTQYKNTFEKINDNNFSNILLVFLLKKTTNIS
jgi:hypothetical protein